MTNRHVDLSKLLREARFYEVVTVHTAIPAESAPDKTMTPTKARIPPPSVKPSTAFIDALPFIVMAAYLSWIRTE